MATKNGLKCVLGWMCVSILLSVSGCSSRYLNADASQLEGGFCYINQEECVFGDNVEFIKYQVGSAENGAYHISGKVNVEMMTTGNQDWVDFWLLLMNEDKVVGERYIKTMGTQYQFDFDLETIAKPTRTTITNVKFWTRT